MQGNQHNNRINSHPSRVDQEEHSEVDKGSWEIFYYHVDEDRKWDLY